MTDPLLSDSAGLIALLAGNAALWFYLEKRTGWRLFRYFPPLVFIYMIPAVLSNTGVIPLESPTWDWMRANLLPMFLVLLLLDIDVGAAVRVMGRGVLVMLAGTAGVVLGAPIGFAAVKGWLGPEAWKGYGALAGSWIGGTGNMAAVAEGLDTPGEMFGLAVIADHAVYLVWLPLLLGSKELAPWFNRFTHVDEARLAAMQEAAAALSQDKGRPELRHLLALLALGAGGAYAAAAVAAQLPELPPVLSTSTWRVLLVTTLGIGLSFTPARRIPGSHTVAMALVYLFVGVMGARASVEALAGQGLPFVAGAYLWILIHGAFLLVAARLLRVDVHSAAIASAANIGGAASAPVVAAHHDERLVPVSILMALLGYAVGNYAAFAAAWLCSLVA
ncbi:MAG: DUF819 family protein [Alphaproteobacteria bacterium]|nr:DUF819 family protein [Alphaproteobacteria bacterium]